MRTLVGILLAAVALHVVLSTRIIEHPRRDPFRRPRPGWPRPRPRPGWPSPIPRRRPYGWKRNSAIDEVDETDDVSDQLVNAVVRAVNEMKFEENRDQEAEDLEEY